ncbi:MAG: hypothetical protein WC390_08730 [Sulfurimonas sp.]|jgi:hypothetical protein
MPRIRTRIDIVYPFSELSPEAKKTALDRLWSINVDHDDWWEAIYADAEDIGLVITSFDLGCRSYCEGKFVLPATEVARNILNNHDKDCETYQTATVFLLSRQSEDKLPKIEEELLKSLCDNYQKILSREYDYLISDATVIDTIEAHDYEFTANGHLA